MAADIKGVFKENQKLFLSIIGIIALALIMSSTSSNEGGFFSFWNLNTNNSTGSGTTGGTTGTNSNGNGGGYANAINTGKNNIYSAPPETIIESNTDYSATIITNLGTVQVDLYEELTPVTVNNFVFLARDGFYDGISIHRVDPNFVIQGGDPLGTGYGGPGYAIRDEIVSNLTFKPFVLAMANSGPNTNGSQFFITTRFSNSASLNGKYTIFGQVTSGFDVVDKIELVQTNENEMPLTPIIIQTVSIQEQKSL